MPLCCLTIYLFVLPRGIFHMQGCDALVAAGLGLLTIAVMALLTLKTSVEGKRVFQPNRQPGHSQSISGYF